MLICVTLAELNGHAALNGNATHSEESPESFARTQIINDEKQFTFVIFRYSPQLDDTSDINVCAAVRS